MSRFRRHIGWMLIAATALACPTWAQDSGPGQDSIDIKALQTKSVLTDEDRTALNKWISERVQTIVNGEGAQANPAVAALRSTYTAAGSANFKETYANACISVIGPAFKSADVRPAARLIAVLSALNVTPAYQVLIEALGDERIAVRTAAAVGLRRLREKIALAGGTYFTETIRALTEAGKKEASTVTLELIYRAMDYPDAVKSPPDPKANALAVLDLLEHRANLTATDKLTAEGADAVGLEIFDDMLPALTDPERNRYIAAVAKLLKFGVLRYTRDLYTVEDKGGNPTQIALRNRFEKLIETANAQLTKATKTTDAPKITDIMANSSLGDKPSEMKLALNRWADLLQEKYQINLQVDAGTDESTNDADGEGAEG